MSNSYQVIVDINCNMHYCAYYIEGLIQIFGNRIKYSSKEFKTVKYNNSCFIFIIETNDKKYNFAIDFHDSRNFDIDILSWSNYYSKINLHKSKLNELNINDRDKIISIPPSFGIRVYGFLKTIRFIFEIIKVNNFKIKNIKPIILNNIKMYINRLPIKHYVPKLSSNGYVFMVATIWDFDTSFANINRANFIKACKENQLINFEGGLVDIGYKCDYISNIDQMLYGNKKIKLSEYILKTQKSNFVFNCPSVQQCHGWKLAEYLCLGKAILSTTLSNELPVPLEHGKNIHIVDDNFASIQGGIQYLIEHPEYVKKLEIGAREYFKAHCAPKEVINKLISKII